MKASIDADSDVRYLTDYLWRKCSRCLEVKQLYQFLHNTTCSGNRTRVCSDCDKEYKLKYYHTNKDRKQKATARKDARS